MNTKTKAALITCVAMLLLTVVGLGLPIWSYAVTGKVKPSLQAITAAVTAAPPAHTAPTASPVQGAETKYEQLTVETMASFYETIIVILLGILAVVGTLAFWSVRLISRTTAEDVAREAARAIIKDSREFRAEVDVAINKAVDEGLEEIREKLEALDAAVTKLSKPDDAAEGATGTVAAPEEE